MTYVHQQCCRNYDSDLHLCPSRIGGSHCYRRSCSSLFQCIISRIKIWTHPSLYVKKKICHSCNSLCFACFQISLICCIHALSYTMATFIPLWQLCHNGNYDLKHHTHSRMYFHSQWDLLLQQTKMYAFLTSLFLSLSLTHSASQYTPHICYTFVFESKLLAHRDPLKTNEGSFRKWFELNMC